MGEWDLYSCHNQYQSNAHDPVAVFKPIAYRYWQACWRAKNVWSQTCHQKLHEIGEVCDWWQRSRPKEPETSVGLRIQGRGRGVPGGSTLVSSSHPEEMRQGRKPGSQKHGHMSCWSHELVRGTRAHLELCQNPQKGVCWRLTLCNQLPEARI